MDINIDEISPEEKDELKNFDVSDELLKDIESSLMMKIKKLFQEEKNENTFNEGDNNIEINENNENNKLDIEKIDSIKINGNPIKINKEEIENKK